MNSKKEILTIILWPLLYTLGMGLSNYIVYHFYHIEYGGGGYINGLSVYLLEYRADRALSKQIDAYCSENGFLWYNADGTELR